MKCKDISSKGKKVDDGATQPMSVHDEDLSIKEAAAKLNLHRNTVTQKIKQGAPEGLDADPSGRNRKVIKLSEVQRYKQYWRDRRND